MARALIQIKVSGANETIAHQKNIINKLTNETRRKILTRIGKRIKTEAKANASVVNFTGQLDTGIIYRTRKESVIIESLAPQSAFIEEGVKPHWVSRNAISVAGYTVADWMEAHGLKGRYMYVGGVGSFIKKPGVRFMKKAYDTVSLEIPTIIKEEIMEMAK